jgi:hypothetical protein
MSFRQGTLQKFRCQGCGVDELVILHDLCPSCRAWGPPVSRWLGLVATLGFVSYLLLDLLDLLR